MAHTGRQLKALFSGKRHELDMTQGSIVKNLLIFALPLLVGNLFQQFYNLVDAWVVGQTDADAAYSAVGTLGPVINILIGFFSGLANGAGVVIAQCFGGKDREGVRRATHTAILMTLAMAVVFTVVGVLATPTVLSLVLHSSEDSAVYPHAKTYLNIYFAGVISLMLYNMGAGILRAVGDSRRPLYFLILSVLTNAGLDIYFVLHLNMGVAGAAWATVISQSISAVLVLLVLFFDQSWVRLSLRAMRVDTSMLSRIIRIGIPAAIQMAVTSFSNVFVLSYISGAVGDQTVNLGAYATFSKVDQFLFLPIQSIALAVSTFVAQNLGTGDVARAKRDTRMALYIATGCTAVITVPITLFASPLARLLKDDPAIVQAATLLLQAITVFHLPCCVNQVYASALRGAGNSRAPMLIMMTSFIGVRQLYLFVVSRFVSNELLPLCMGFPVGWLVCSLIITVYYHRFRFAPIPPRAS